MAKLLVLYNLAPNVTDDQYREYVTKDKGPLMGTFSAIKKFELTKTIESPYGKSPYKYIGIIHLRSLEDFQKKDFPSPKFQEMMKKWKSMVTDIQYWFADEIY